MVFTKCSLTKHISELSQMKPMSRIFRFVRDLARSSVLFWLDKLTAMLTHQIFNQVVKH